MSIQHFKEYFRKIENLYFLDFLIILQFYEILKIGE